jgi:hypothetical protein
LAIRYLGIGSLIPSQLASNAVVRGPFLSNISTPQIPTPLSELSRICRKRFPKVVPKVGGKHLNLKEELLGEFLISLNSR